MTNILSLGDFSGTLQKSFVEYDILDALVKARQGLVLQVTTDKNGHSVKRWTQTQKEKTHERAVKPEQDATFDVKAEIEEAKKTIAALLKRYDTYPSHEDFLQARTSKLTATHAGKDWTHDLRNPKQKNSWTSDESKSARREEAADLKDYIRRLENGEGSKGTDAPPYPGAPVPPHKFAPRLESETYIRRMLQFVYPEKPPEILFKRFGVDYLKGEQNGKEGFWVSHAYGDREHEEAVFYDKDKFPELEKTRKKQVAEAETRLRQSNFTVHAANLFKPRIL
jgi:hypothetical protein